MRRSAALFHRGLPMLPRQPMRVSAAWLLMLAAFAAAPAWAQSTNQLYMTGTGSGNAPAISANGVDTNISMALMPKGAGYVGVGTATPAAKIHDIGGIIIGPDAQSCTSANNGELQYTSASASYSYCNGSAWVPFDPCHSIIQPYVYGQPSDFDLGGGNPGPMALTTDGTYIYVGEGGGANTDLELLAFTFNTSTHAWTLVSNQTTYTGGSVDADGMLYQNGLLWTVGITAAGTKGEIQTWTFSGTTFTNKASNTTALTNESASDTDNYGVDIAAGDGTYVYVADQEAGLKAFSGSGTTLTYLSTTPYKPSGADITDVYAVSTGHVLAVDNANCKIYSLTYSGGVSFTLSSTLTGVCGVAPIDYSATQHTISGDGTYIYIADGTNSGNLYAYTLSGTTWTKVGTLAAAAAGYFDPSYVWASSATPGMVYTSSLPDGCADCAYSSGVVYAYKFNGSTFAYHGSLPSYQSNLGSFPLPGYTDGNYLYYVDTMYDWAVAFPVCN